MAQKFTLNARDIPRIKSSIEGELKSKIEKSNDKWKSQAQDLLKEEVLSSISRGQSPVLGGGNQTGGGQRYTGYSPSYSDAIKKGRYDEYGKKLRPVNLNLSGKMLESLKTVPTAKGIKIYFGSKIADYHNEEGAGKSKVIRRLLPKDGESFSRVITQKLADLYIKLFK